MRVDRPDAAAKAPEGLKPKAAASDASPDGFRAALDEARTRRAAEGEFDALHREVERIAESTGFRRARTVVLDGAHASLDSLDKASLSIIAPFSDGIGGIDTIGPVPSGPGVRPPGPRVGPYTRTPKD